MFGIDFDDNGRVIGSTEPKKTENKAMIKRINPLQVAMKKKQEMEATEAKNTSNEDKTKEVAAEVINSDTMELQKHRYCGIRPGSKMPDCKWTTQSIDWDSAQTKSDLAIIIPDDYIVVDIDDEQEGKALLKLVETNSQEYDTVISCVMRTDHGYHFWFRKPQDVTLEATGIKHTSKVKTLLTLSVDYRIGGKGYMVIRRDGKDRQWVHGSWADLSDVATIPNILYPIAPTDDRHKALYQAKASKYGYQVLPDGRMGSYCGLPKGQRTMALLAYYGYLKTFYADIPARSVEDCQMIIYNINRYLCAEPIPDEELWAEILSNTERVMVTADNGGDNSGNNSDREQNNNQDGGEKLISLNLHGQATVSQSETNTTPTNSTTPVNTATPTRVRVTNNNNISYEDMAQDIIDTYGLIYHSNNYYVYNNGVYEPLNRNPKDSEILLERMVMAQYPGLLAKYKKEIIRNIRSMTIVTNSDDNGNLLALNNGVYNTDTHTFVGWTDIEMGRYHFFKRIPITYQTLIPVNQTITDFEAYRSSLFSDDTAEEYKKILDQILGYTFYRQLTAQKIFFFYGPGGTGKTTYANFLLSLLGKDNTRNMTLDRVLGDKFALSGLKGVMLNVGDETITANDIKSVDLLKSLAVRCNIEVEAKYQGAENVELFAKHIYCTNDRPKVQDKAFWSRVIVIPFNNVFRDTANNIPDDKLQVIMDNEDVKSYMFNVAMESLKELQANNWQFSVTSDMLAAKENFIPVCDTIDTWINAASVDDDMLNQYKTSEVYSLYRQWCEDHRYKPQGRNYFVRTLKESYNVTTKNKRVKDPKGGKDKFIVVYTIRGEIDD